VKHCLLFLVEHFADFNMRCPWLIAVDALHVKKKTPKLAAAFNTVA
jgi:hypothetical protein